MNLTQEKLVELGWMIDQFNEFNFMRKDDKVLIPMAGVWMLGRLIFGQPHIAFGVPNIYIATEEDYYKVIS